MAHELESFGKLPHISRIEALEFDIDIRMLDLWRELCEFTEDEMNLVRVAAFMRAAYGKGYADALVEEDRGKLAREHGYRIPSPRPEIFPEHEQL